MRVESLGKGKELELVGVISSSKHGITTIDSGGGQQHYLIAKDLDGKLYKIFWVSLGINKSDTFIALKDSFSLQNGTYEMFSSDSFNWGINRAKDNIVYTGKLTRE